MVNKFPPDGTQMPESVSSRDAKPSPDAGKSGLATVPSSNSETQLMFASDHDLLYHLMSEQLLMVNVSDYGCFHYYRQFLVDGFFCP